MQSLRLERFCGGNRMNIQDLIWYIKYQGDFDYSVAELERLGLEEICRRYNIDYDEMTEAERNGLWAELIALAEEVEFKKYFEENYTELD